MDERAQHQALLDASVQLVLAEGAPAALERDARAWFASNGVSADDAAQLGALGARRLLVYRRHVRRGLHRAVRQEIPRTAARLGDAFAPWVDRWIEHSGPRSHYFRDLAFELVAWAVPRWRADTSVPAYIADLARHELLYFDVASSEGPGSGGRGDRTRPGPSFCEARPARPL